LSINSTLSGVQHPTILRQAHQQRVYIEQHPQGSELGLLSLLKYVLAEGLIFFLSI